MPGRIKRLCQGGSIAPVQSPMLIGHTAGATADTPPDNAAQQPAGDAARGTQPRRGAEAEQQADAAAEKARSHHKARATAKDLPNLPAGYSMANESMSSIRSEAGTKRPAPPVAVVNVDAEIAETRSQTFHPKILHSPLESDGPLAPRT